MAVGLAGIDIVSDKGFGEMAVRIVPESSLRHFQETGIDVPAVAKITRWLTIGPQARTVDVMRVVG